MANISYSHVTLNKLGTSTVDIMYPETTGHDVTIADDSREALSDVSSIQDASTKLSSLAFISDIDKDTIGSDMFDTLLYSPSETVDTSKFKVEVNANKLNGESSTYYGKAGSLVSSNTLNNYASSAALLNDAKHEVLTSEDTGVTATTADMVGSVDISPGKWFIAGNLYFGDGATGDRGCSVIVHEPVYDGDTITSYSNTFLSKTTMPSPIPGYAYYHACGLYDNTTSGTLNVQLMVTGGCTSLTYNLVAIRICD